MSVSGGGGSCSEDTWRDSILGSPRGVFLWLRLRGDQWFGFYGCWRRTVLVSSRGSSGGLWSGFIGGLDAGSGGLSSQVASGASGSSF